MGNVWHGKGLTALTEQMTWHSWWTEWRTTPSRGKRTCSNKENTHQRSVEQSRWLTAPKLTIVWQEMSMRFQTFVWFRALFHLILCSGIYETVTQVNFPQTFWALPNFFLSYFSIPQSVSQFFLGEFLGIFYVAILSNTACGGRLAVFPVQFLQAQEGHLCVYAVVPVWICKLKSETGVIIFWHLFSA